MEIALERRSLIAQHGRRLEFITITWNSLEGLLAVLAGVLAGSIALVGFGIDSFIEVISAAALLWRMSVDADEHNREHHERLALQVVGLCFIALALYIAVDSTKQLISQRAPERSLFGIAIAAAALIVMPILSRAKRHVASQLDSAAMKADSRQTDFCAYLSAIVLVGLAANWLLGWWWADPVAALIMVPIIANEGRESLRGKQCSDCH
jgi:divalent metal cation (Fe/Co/Zn/Cd) transporter